MVKSRKNKKGTGFFRKTRKNSLIVSANRYEQDGWNMLSSIITSRELELDENWSVKQVDTLLSKWVDTPRNIDELRRVEHWTNIILDHKSYTTTTKLRAMLHKLKHRALC
jgi:hypothetical protein